jgi:cyclic pyranopterin phosphate synthase
MVDVTRKAATARRAVASAKVLLNKETLKAIKTQTNPKGDPLEIARIAGIIAAKKTADLIPLCHPLPLSKIGVKAELTEYGVYLESEAKTTAQTGLEMEALTAVSVAALTVYDMCKALDKGIAITDVRLEKKSGGKSGDFKR